MKLKEKKDIIKKYENFESRSEAENYLKSESTVVLKKFAQVLNTPFYSTFFNNGSASREDIIEDICDVLFGEK